MTQLQSAIQEVLAGYIERVTYHNAVEWFLRSANQSARAS
jgi:hypothetical protein